MAEGGRRMGSVKAAINMYGQKATRSISPQLDLSSVVNKSPSGAEELHKSGKELGLYRESTRASDSAKAKAEAQLRKAKETVQDLTLLIEESNRRLTSSKISIKLKIDGSGQTMRELEDMKQQLIKLKLYIAYVTGEKIAADTEVIEVRSKMEKQLKLLESLKLEVDVANEELVLVELAKIEALKERKEIEVERKEMFDSLEEKKKRMLEMTKEVERSKEREIVLSETLSDIEVLEAQLKLVHSTSSMTSRDRKDELSVLKEVTEAKKEELASIEAEIFRVVNIMDALRRELEQAKQENAKFEKMLQKDDVMIERLNSKLLMAKAKLEGEERITSLVDNLTCSLEKLKSDKEVAKKEEMKLKEEAMIIKDETKGFGGKEKEFISKLDELERAKQAECFALERLESMVEKAMEARESKCDSSITISRFEYEYLSGEASQAEEAAGKKVEAAMAWVEAIKASTKEIVMKTETLDRESGKTMVEEERESFRMQRSLSIKRLVQEEIEKYKEEPEDMGMISPKVVRKSVRLSGKYTTRRYSLGNRGTPSYFVIKKKKKVPNLVKFFTRKKR